MQYLLSLELHSPMVISYQQRKVIFRENEFTENVGWSGGAIQIESPHQVSSDPELRPYVQIIGNTFDRNQAYIGGGAVYVRGTRR